MEERVEIGVIILQSRTTLSLFAVYVSFPRPQLRAHEFYFNVISIGNYFSIQ